MKSKPQKDISIFDLMEELLEKEESFALVTVVKGPPAGEKIIVFPDQKNEIDFYGSCDGTVLEWCGRNGLRSRDCAANGEFCVFEGPDEGYGCADCVRCDGVCTDISFSMEHCGACDNPCAPANGYGLCDLGTCMLLDCKTGFFDADGDPTNGCEFDFLQHAIDNGFEPGEQGCTAAGLPLWWLLLSVGVLRFRRRMLD